jgi:hypothetical protein
MNLKALRVCKKKKTFLPTVKFRQNTLKNFKISSLFLDKWLKSCQYQYLLFLKYKRYMKNITEAIKYTELLKVMNMVKSQPF